MNHTLRLLSALALGAAAQLTQAHDPAEHARDAAASKGPNCAAMKDMDHSQMNPNDPVMKAMMARCGDAMKSHDAGHSPMGKPQQAPAATPAHNHHGSH